MQRFVYVVAVLFLACLIFSCSGDKKETSQVTPNQTTTQSTAQAGQADANVPATIAGIPNWTALDTKGQPHHASEWIGKQPTVINFWGTWCPPCRREIPDLVRLHAEYEPKGIQIVGLAVKDQATNVQIFANEAKMNWVMLMGTPDIADIYGGIQGVPTTIFFDKDGKEVQRFVGGRSYEDFKSAFDAILKGYTPPGQQSSS